VTAPEPWREVPPPKRRNRRGQNPWQLDCEKTQRATETEFGFGKGLVAPCNNGKPPSEGGIYLGTAPRTYLPENSLTPRQVERPKGEVRGYPGEIVAR
jgi:hypothetical protein